MTRNPAKPLWDNSNKRTRESKNFTLSYSRAVRKPDTFKNECHSLAQKISIEANGMPLYVCLSGGVDGEIVCRSFLESGLNFTPVVFEYKKHIRQDLALVHSFIKNYKLELKTMPFDEADFLQNGLKKWTSRYPITEPFTAFDMERIDRLDGAVVCGCGDLVLEPSENGIVSKERGTLFQTQIYMTDESRTGCYQFFQGSAEIMLAFLTEPIIQKWIQLQPQMNFSNSREFKFYLYKYLWPDLESRKKWTGYERFADIYGAAQNILEKEFPISSDHFDIKITNLIEQIQLINR